jgi:hypothetical protein
MHLRKGEWEMRMSLKRKFKRILQTLVILALIAPFYSLADFGIASVSAADNLFQEKVIVTNSSNGLLRSVYVKVKKEVENVGIWNDIIVTVTTPNGEFIEKRKPSNEKFINQGEWKNVTQKETCSNSADLCDYVTGYYEISFNTPIELTETQSYLLKVESSNLPPNKDKKVGSMSILEIEPSLFAPLTLSADKSYESVELEWDEIGATRYEVYRGETLLTTTTDLTYEITGLTVGTKYNFQVIGVDYKGNKTEPTRVEVVTLPRPATPKFSQDANNEGDAFDRNINTSGNIMSSTGYIIFKLSDIGEGTNSITLGLSEAVSRTISVEYLNQYYQTIPGLGDSINASGPKEESRITVPLGTRYVKVKGTSGANVYIYEIGVASGGTTTPVTDLLRGVSNYTDAFDGKTNTSGNIMTGDGYITFKIGENGLPSKSSTFTIGTSRGEEYRLDVEYLDENKQRLGALSGVRVSGFKGDYNLAIRTGSHYIRIHGQSEIEVYIYEITKPTTGEPSSPGSADLPPGLEISDGVINFEHAYDGNFDTSGNIMTNTGKIVFKVDPALTKLTAGSQSIFTIGTHNGERNNIRVDFLDSNKALIEGSGIVVEANGFKNEYPISLPNGVGYIRFHGLENVKIYIYELTKTVTNGGTPPTIPDGLLHSQGVINYEHAYDGETNTSGNIMTNDGYITYKLSEIGLFNAANSTLTIGTNNGGEYDLKIEFLNSNKFVRETKTQRISGYKNEYLVPFNVGASFIRIRALDNAEVYIYELKKSGSGDIGYSGGSVGPGGEPLSGVSNYVEAFDGKDTTSGNVLTDDGYISFKIGQNGLTRGQVSTFIIGTHNGEKHTLSIDFMNASKQVIPGSAITAEVAGFKDEVPILMNAGADAVYVRINGLDGVEIYIYEVSKTTGGSEGPPTPTGPIMFDKANNITEAYDTKDTTSANILEGTGFIIYKLADLGLTPISNSKYIIGTTGEGNHSVQLEYLDDELKTISSGTLSVSGFKNESYTEIPADVTYVKIRGVSGTVLTIYEISED